MVNPSVQKEYNPNRRHPLHFTKKIPGRLETGISRLAFVLDAETFIEGVDLSHWNWSEGREPNFSIIRDNGFDFVILKSTESNWFMDDTFERSYQRAIGNELIPMTYHFFRDYVDGGEQAEWCLTNINQFLDLVEGKTIIFDDLEINGGATVSWRQDHAEKFNKTVAGNQIQTGNYSSKYLWEKLMGTQPLLWVDDYFQWPAHWTPAPAPLKPVGWNRKDFWQYGIWPTYSWAKEVGTDGNVDVNRFYGTRQDLKDALGIVAPLPPDCCEEVKKGLAEVWVEIDKINGKISSHDQKINLIDDNQVAMMNLITQLQNEMKVAQGQLTFQSETDKALQNQLDILFKIMGDIKRILC